MFKILVTIASFLLFFSCDSAKESDYATYFGGKITNPKSNFVTLKKGEIILDTLFLDEENNFGNTYNISEEGVYTFGHGYELQYMYLQQKDSINVSLNTLDFDESIVYSGKGFEKNEYLINLFLENENDSKNFHHYYKLSPQEFKDKIILMQELKHARFLEFETEQNILSENYKKIISATIDFPLLKKMEYYPIAHKKITKATYFPPLTDDFYDFRKTLNLNDSTLVEYYAYTNYIINYLYNQAFCNIKTLNNTKHSLRICFFKSIEKNIKIENFKNQLLMGNILHNTLKNSHTDDLNVLELFLKISTNEKDKEKIKKLLADKKALTNNQAISNFEVQDLEGQKENIKNLINNKETVIYFWSHKYMSTAYLNSRIAYLTKKHPTTVFIGINTDSYKKPHTSDINDSKSHYQLTTTSIGHKYNSSGYPRTIIVSNTGKIKNSYTNISSKDFSSNLIISQKN